MRISRNENYSFWVQELFEHVQNFHAGLPKLCPSLNVPNLLPNEDELTIQVPGHSWLFLVILAMTITMTVTINSNSVRQVGMKVLNMFKDFVYPAQILFIRGYAHWKRVVIFFVAQLTYCILVILAVFLVVLTVYYVIRKSQWDWGSWSYDNAK